MSGSRSKKSGGKYDNPGVPSLINSTKYENVHDYGGPSPKILGTGAAGNAAKKIKKGRDKRFPNPDDY